MLNDLRRWKWDILVGFLLGILVWFFFGIVLAVFG